MHDIVTCPHCSTRVVPKGDGKCPSCQFAILMEQVDEASTSSSSDPTADERAASLGDALSNAPTTGPPPAPQPSTGGGGMARAVFIIGFVIVCAVVFGKRDPEPSSKQIPGRWVSWKADGQNASRRYFGSDGTTFCEALGRDESRQRFNPLADSETITEHRDGTYQFLDSSRLEIRWQNGTTEIWSVQFIGGQLEMTSQDGRREVYHTDVGRPTYAPTTASGR